jgi:predicted ester cyclase
MKPDQMRKSVREFTRIFKNEHNVEGVGHLFAEDFKHSFKMPLSPGFKGFKEIGTMMNTAFPDVVVTEEDLIVEEDRVVERSTAKATHKGPFMQYAPTNQKILWSEIHIYRFNEQNKIAEHWVELSMLELLTQIGAVKMA